MAPQAAQSTVSGWAGLAYVDVHWLAKAARGEHPQLRGRRERELNIDRQLVMASYEAHGSRR